MATEEKTYGFKTTCAPNTIQRLEAFKENLIKMMEVQNVVQKKLLSYNPK